MLGSESGHPVAPDAANVVIQNKPTGGETMIVMAATTEEDVDVVHAIISNIPYSYHSSDLRNYFSQIIEADGFDCFHFRHRPEANDNATNRTGATTPPTPTTTSTSSSASRNVRKTTCCVVRMTALKLNEFINLYHRKHWHDENGDSSRSLCLIAKIKVSETNGNYARTNFKSSPIIARHILT